MTVIPAATSGDRIRLTGSLETHGKTPLTGVFFLNTTAIQKTRASGPGWNDHFVRYFVARAAARFVALVAADLDRRSIVERRKAIRQTLAARRLQIAAAHADSREFRNLVGPREKQRHDAERFASEIGIEPGAHDFVPARKKRLGHVNDAVIKELCLVEADEPRTLHRHKRKRFVRPIDHDGRVRLAVARADFDPIARIHCRLEGKDGDLGEGRAPQKARELAAFARRHATANDVKFSAFFGCGHHGSDQYTRQVAGHPSG